MTFTVTVMGLGSVGQAIARTLLTAGHDVTVWNRTPEKAEPLAELGARVAASPREAVRRSAVTLISARGNAVARDVLNQADLAGIEPLLVNLSSDTPSSARELATWVISQGVRYLAGTMLTPSVMVGQPGSTAILAGTQATYEEARPILRLIAPEVAHYSDDPGTVAALDLALLDVFWTTIAGWSHAIALARAEGLKAEEPTDRLTAMVYLAAHVGAGISHDAEVGNYPGNVSTITSAHTTLAHIIQASTDRSIDTSIPNSIKELLQRAIDHDHQGDRPSRLVPTIERTHN